MEDTNVLNVIIQFIFQLSYKFTLWLTRCRIKEKYFNNAYGFKLKIETCVFYSIYHTKV